MNDRAAGRANARRYSSAVPLTRSVRSKGAGTLLRRLRLITRRFEWGPRPMRRALARYLGVLRDYQAPATWTVTANALVREPDLVRPFLYSSIELGIHGWRHTDHQCCDLATQRAEVQRAIAEMDRRGFYLLGWRSPYLRSGPGTLDQVAASGLRWEASASLEFPTEVRGGLDPEGADTWTRAIRFYGAEHLDTRLALPTIEQGVVRFPTALPDDEMLIDRLARPAADLERTWCAMLDRTSADGELLVLQLHPERAPDFAAPLATVLRRARAAEAGVWVAALRDLAAWWERRAAATLTVTRDDTGWAVAVHGPPGPELEMLQPTSETARSLVMAGDGPPTPMPTGRDRRVAVRGDVWPGVGVAVTDAPRVIGRLHALGFAAEARRPEQHYAVTVRDSSDAALVAFARRAARGEGLEAPLPRLACWPAGYRSALAITGDICAITLYDFAVRTLGLA